jgi:hypothetical protein
MQQMRNAQQARQSPLNANATPDMGTPDMGNQIPGALDPNGPGGQMNALGPLPNLQLPPNRQRLLNQAQARQGGPGMANGMQQGGQMPMMAMNPQMQQVQNQVASAAAAQMAAFKAQSQSQMMQNPPSLPHGITQSPRSMAGTPQMGQNPTLPANMRAGTPNRVASLAGGLQSRQGSITGSPQLNGSPGLANANIISGMPTNGMMNMPGQQLGQHQLQGHLTQISQHAQAQLQANLQNQGGQPIMPHPGGPLGNGMAANQQGMIPPPMPMGQSGPQPGTLPPGHPGQMNQMQAQMAQMQARDRSMGFPANGSGQPLQPAECPPVTVEVQISQVLPASAKTFPFVTKYPDTKPLRPSLNGGLAAGMTLGLPPHLQRPASIGRYLSQLQRDIASSGIPKLAMKGTIFEKLKSSVKEGDEVEEESAQTSFADGVKEEKMVVAPEEDLVEYATSPNTGKRKLADLARCFYPNVDITEAAEDVSLVLVRTIHF